MTEQPVNGTPQEPPTRTDIFPYFDGARQRWADPRRVQRLLATQLEGQYHQLMDDLRTSALRSEEARECRAGYERRAAGPPEPNHDPAPPADAACQCWTCQALQVALSAEAASAAASLTAWQGVSVLVPVVRDVFEMVAFDPNTGQGATEEQCLDCLFAFEGYRSGLKKSTAKPPTSPQPAAGAPSPPSSAPTPQAPTSAPTAYG